MSGRCSTGIRTPSPAMRSSSRPAAWSCRTSPACPAWSTWPRCATRSRPWAATRRSSTRRCSPTWSSTIRCRSTTTAWPMPSNATWTSNTGATANATSSCAGGSRPSGTSAWCRRAPASSTRSTSNTWLRSSCARPRRTPTAASSPTSIPASAPTRTPPRSTAWACSAGASAASRRRPPCSASRSPCWCRASSASSSPAPSRRASRPPMWS